MIHRMRPARSPWKTGLAWMLLILIGLGAAAFYFHLYPDRLPEWAARSSLGRDLQTTTVYKWQDASGRWHVSDQRPATGVEYRTEEYTHDTNVLPLPPELQK